MKSGVVLFQLNHVQLEKKTRTILRDVNLTVHSGEFLVILGPSGAGKTSLLRLFNFLETPTGGEIFFKGKNIREWHVPDLRRKATLVLQKPQMFEGTVRENLILGLKLAHWKIPETEQLGEWLEECGLSKDLLGERAEHLSGGEQQRLSLARALALNPEVLLLDEPTASLDVESERRLIETIRRENQQNDRTILCVSHSLPLIQSASRLIFLDNGEIVSDRFSASDEEIRIFLKEALDAQGNH